MQRISVGRRDRRLGIAGALVGTWIGRIFAGGNYVAGWIMSVVGAMILLLLYRLLFRRGV